MMIAVDEAHGAVGHDGVEGGRLRGAAGEMRHGPAAAGDPGAVGVRSGVFGDGREGEGRVARLREIALQQLEPAHDGVRVRVDEARHKEAAIEVDAPGVRPGQGCHGVGAGSVAQRDGDDPAGPHGHTHLARRNPPCGVRAAAREDQVGGRARRAHGDILAEAAARIPAGEAGERMVWAADDRAERPRRKGPLVCRYRPVALRFRYWPF